VEKTNGKGHEKFKILIQIRKSDVQTSRLYFEYFIQSTNKRNHMAGSNLSAYALDHLMKNQILFTKFSG